MDAAEKYWNRRSEREVGCELDRTRFRYWDRLELIYVHVLAWFSLRGWGAPGVPRTIVNVKQTGVASPIPYTPHLSYPGT